MTPEKWLLKYMKAQIDCVAVTDHNSGDWIDKLKNAYALMQQRVEEGTPPAGFRKLTIFPGVEISVNGGIHLLAIFDPETNAEKIDQLLGSVRYKGSIGDTNGVTEASLSDVLQGILNAGGIPIPAHADQSKGLFRVKHNTRECVLDARTVLQAVDIDGLFAVEWLDLQSPPPDCVRKKVDQLTKVLGSDCHGHPNKGVPGSRYTWIKMGATPTLNGVRLALIDGNGVSVWRSDDADFRPFQIPKHFITSIEIESARFMGNRNPERLEFSPYSNALIGGRGTGKSSIIHAARLAYQRGRDLERLGGDADPYHQFKNFTKTPSDRHAQGALREGTAIRIEILRDGVAHRLRWSNQNGQNTIVEEKDENGEWRDSNDQTLASERFPVRLLSQGQISAMVGDNKQALLDIIDEAAGVLDVQRRFENEKRKYFSSRARLRELDGQLEGRPELKRKLTDLNRKLEAITRSRHAEIFKARQQTLRQRQEIRASLKQLNDMSERINTLAQDILLDDWPDGVFNSARDQDVVALKAEMEQASGEARNLLAKAASILVDKIQSIKKDRRLAKWSATANKAKADYQALQDSFAEQGVQGPRDFGDLAQKRQQLENQIRELDKLRKYGSELETDSEYQWVQVLKARQAITEARQKFVQNSLKDNEFVRMEVTGFGFNPRSVERSLREMLGCLDDRFEKDILQADHGKSGLAFDLAQARSEDKEVTLEKIKKRLITVDGEFGKRFQKFLQRKLDHPEFEDRIRCWFPEDDLRAEYSRTGRGNDWEAIEQGSQGQRSAALLAFLLAFGEEPLILDQPEDDLDNHVIYELIVRQILENKRRRQLIIATHNPNIVVNGDAEMVHALGFKSGQCRVTKKGALQDEHVREEVCHVMEGGHKAFKRRWMRLGREV